MQKNYKILTHNEQYYLYAKPLFSNKTILFFSNQSFIIKFINKKITL